MGTATSVSESPYAKKPWLKHYDFWVPATATYPRQPAYRTLDIGASNYPDRPATIFFGAEMTFRQLKDRSLRLATALYEFGIGKGDRVGVMLPNCPQFPISFFGVLRTGATIVCINPTYTPREFERLARDSGIRALIALDQIVPALVPSLANTAIEDIIVTNIEDYMHEHMAGRYVPERAEQLERLAEIREMVADVKPEIQVYSFASVIQQTNPRQIKVEIDPEADVAALQYTGGTTGTPKGAMLTHFNLFANTTQSTMWRSYFKTQEGDRALMVIPLFHVYGLTVGMMIGALQGVTLILIPKYDVELLIDAITRYRPTIVPGVPTLYVSLLNHPRVAEIDFSSIKSFNSGSAPLPLDVIDRWEALTGGILRQGYGLSETSPTTHSQSQLGLRKPDSCGIPFPDTECKIVDLEAGEREMPVGEPGELIIRGPQVMRGYWQQPEETARALRPDPDGRGPWFYTGDIARMDQDGYFYIVQRKKDMILVSGFNVYPGEVEEVLYMHPAVMEAGVVGVADEYRGERVVAYVALRPDARATAEELLEHCKSNLTRYKVPSEIRFLPELPKTVVGKILHRSLRDLSQKSD
jgi:long-chain acyl-CoA synthetase